MKNLRYLIIALVPTLLWQSCSNDLYENESRNTTSEINFTSIIEGEYGSSTRAMNTSWSPGDKIGVFMKKEGQTLSDVNIVSSARNSEYLTAKGNGMFAPVDQAISYPADGAKVDFIAYYPFNLNAADYTYKIDIGTQTDQEEIDLLYSDNLTSMSKEDPTAEMHFKHKLSRLSFTFVKGDNTTTLQGLSATILGVPTEGSMSLATGEINIDRQSAADVEVYVYNDGSEGEVILLPEGKKDLKIKFTLAGKSFTHTINNVNLSSNIKNSYKVKLGFSGGEVVPDPDYAMWNETPLFAPQPTYQYVSHGMSGSTSTKGVNIGVRNFSMLYDKENRVALWVAYPMHKGYLGSVKRSEAWKYDPVIAEKDQPNLKKSWPSYPMYNRGHQIASSDRTASSAANRMTFYYSNMTLQQVEFNGGTWNNLENKVRSWCGAGASDTVYVVTGVILTTPEKPNIERLPDTSGTLSAVPQYFYKALARIVGGKYYSMVYKLPNVRPASGDKFYNEKYKITLNALEKETGFTFFPNLPIENRGSIEDSKWPL